jgi:signal transduction histidine kinase
VFANLLDNAERHAGGATRIDIRRRCDTFEVTIDDGGPGIPPEVRSQVFERFWRGPAARQHSNRGTGLGLSLVEEQVRIVGGTVAFRDNPSGGARAVIELPAGREGP